MVNINYEASVKLVRKLQSFMRKQGYKLDRDMSTEQDIPFSLAWEKGDIVIWTRGTKIEHAWLNDGSVSIGARFEGTFMNANTAREIELIAERHWAKTAYICCKCGKDFKGVCAGSHFAGEYCLDCWAKYQAENSGNCLICGVPRWKCCC